MLTVGHERRALQTSTGAQTDAGRELVADEAEQTRDRERPEIVEMLRVGKSVDRLDCGDRGRNEDRQYHGISGPAFASLAARKKRNSKRDRGECVATVVNQVGKQGDRPGQGEHDSLQRGGDPQDRETPRHRPNTRTRSNDRPVNTAVRMPVLAMAVLVVVVVVVVLGRLSREEWKPRMAVWAVMVMLMRPAAVSMRQGAVHATESTRATGSRGASWPVGG